MKWLFNYKSGRQLLPPVAFIICRKAVNQTPCQPFYHIKLDVNVGSKLGWIQPGEMNTRERDEHETHSICHDDNASCSHGGAGC